MEKPKAPTSDDLSDNQLALAERINSWLPANLREVEDDSMESVSERNND